MIAVVYSGSHYAHWRLADKEKTVASFRTNGINPYFSDQKSILQLLSKNINLIHHAEEIKRIYFFGAGTSTVEFREVVHNAFATFFKYSKVSVEHDIAGAAIACGKRNNQRHSHLPTRICSEEWTDFPAECLGFRWARNLPCYASVFSNSALALLTRR